MPFIKNDVEPHEVLMQERARSILPDHVPDILSYDPATKVLRMQAIQGSSLADFYGEQATAVPPKLWTEVRRLVSVLLQNGMIYRDITGYNFIMEEKTGKIYIIDFEHAKATSNTKVPSFVQEFVSGAGGVYWNPDFA